MMRITMRVTRMKTRRKKRRKMRKRKTMKMMRTRTSKTSITCGLGEYSKAVLSGFLYVFKI